MIIERVFSFRSLLPGCMVCVFAALLPFLLSQLFQFPSAENRPEGLFCFSPLRSFSTFMNIHKILLRTFPLISFFRQLELDPLFARPRTKRVEDE